MPESFYLMNVLMSGGFAFCLACLCLFVSYRIKRNSTSWLLLAAMGLFETFYTITFYQYINVTNIEQAYFWAVCFCIGLPVMTGLYASLTLNITKKPAPWLKHLPTISYILAAGFSILLTLDYSSGTRAIIHHIDFNPMMMSNKIASFSLIGQAWLGLVDMIFLICAYILWKNYKAGAKEYKPLIWGSLVYFFSVISDFNIVFRVYDFYYLQHLGFLVMTFGFIIYLAEDYRKSVSDLEIALTEIEMYRNELLQAEKLKLMGTMSSFLVHEIRNPLMIIQHAAQKILHQVPEDHHDKINPSIERIQKHIKLSAGIVGIFANFTQKTDPNEFKTVKLASLVQEAIALAEFRNVEKMIIPELCFNQQTYIHCIPQYMIQCFVNLINNSCDALEKNQERWIKIFSEESNEVIEIRFIDSGLPPKELNKKVGKLFNSTKKGGSGLGLGIMKLLLERQKWRFTLDRNHKNTCFLIRYEF